MQRTISGVMAYVDGRFVPSDISVDGGKIVSVSPAAKPVSDSPLYAFPGFTDVHVHLREPGFSYKETIAHRHAGGGPGAATPRSAPCRT